MGLASATESYLRDFHRRHPGSTVQLFGEATLETGDRHWSSSYAWLADQVPRTSDPLSVLDLACGSGEVLRLLAERAQPGLSLTGVDLSPSELAVAAQLLGDRARLIEARAQSLPLPPESIDMVVSHLALMLMEEIEAVVAAIHRVLKPGGRLTCVLWRSAIPGDAFAVFGHALRSEMARENITAHQIGDRRTLAADELSALFATHFASIAVTDLTVRQRGTPAEIWDRLVPNYDVDLLSAEGARAFRADFLRKLTPLLDKDGKVTCSMGLRALTAQRE